MRIAIVDDSGTARMFIRRCLEIAGFHEAEIIEAENGRDALEAIRLHPVDLLLTDLTMPVMDGLTLCSSGSSPTPDLSNYRCW